MMDKAVRRRLVLIWIKLGALSGLASGITIGVTVGLVAFLLTSDGIVILWSLVAGPAAGTLLGMVAAGVSGLVATFRHDPAASSMVMTARGRRSVLAGAVVIALVVGIVTRQPLFGIATFVIGVLVGRTVVPMIVIRY
jgi:hypothetical protein